MTTRRRDLSLALALILLVLGGGWYRSVAAPLWIFDQPFYLGIAYDIRHEGVFSNGIANDERPDGERPPGMFFGPAEPALLAAASLVDPAFDRAMSCVVESRGHDPSCPKDATVVRTANFLMLVAMTLMLWWAATAASGSRRVGWIALAMFLVTGGGFIVSANYTMTEIPSLFFFTGATAAVVAALRGRRRAAWLATAGAALALAALTRPAFFYLFVAACLTGGLWALVRADRRRSLGLLAAFAVGGAVTMAPWIARNAVQFGHPAITFGYDAHVLVQRISFDHMTPHQYALSYVCWLPDGNGIGNGLFGPRTCDVFNWDDRPDTFYSIGNNELQRDSLAAAGSQENFLPYLLRHDILGHPLKHLLVSIPLALRGAWIDHYWGLVGFVLCVILTGRAIRRRDLAFLAMSVPAWFMLLFNAAVAVNQTRYNLMLAIPFALSFGIYLDQAWSALQARLGRNSGSIRTV